MCKEEQKFGVSCSGIRSCLPALDFACLTNKFVVTIHKSLKVYEFRLM